MANKKIIALAFTAFLAAFGAYKAFSDLAKAFEDLDFEEEEDNEF
jgi:hypothetical protein